MVAQSLSNMVFAVDKKELSLDDQNNIPRRIYQQGKQVSQIIAYIWRWVDDISLENKKKQEVANELQKYFKNPTENVQEPGGRLKRLLGAHPNDSSYEGNLLYHVFLENAGMDNEGYIFPMFSKLELGKDGSGLGYSINVDINSYQGNLSDTSINHPYQFVHTIPYPPRPHLSKATVTLDELESWVENRVPEQYYADNPYIPTTST